MENFKAYRQLLQDLESSMKNLEQAHKAESMALEFADFIRRNYEPGDRRLIERSLKELLEGTGAGASRNKDLIASIYRDIRKSLYL